MSNVVEKRSSLDAGLGILEQRVIKVGDSRLGDEIALKVGNTTMLSLISQRLSFVVNLRSVKVNTSAEQVERYLKTLLHYRVLQTQRMRLPMNPGDIYVPSFFFPVLCAIGRYEDPSRALRLICDEEMPSDIMTPEEVAECGFMLSAAGVKVDRGLPRELMVDTDSVFRVKRDGTSLFVAGPDVGELILLIRTVLDVEFCAELYGAPRTKYLEITDANAAWDAIIGLACS